MCWTSRDRQVGPPEMYGCCCLSNNLRYISLSIYNTYIYIYIYIHRLCHVCIYVCVYIYIYFKHSHCINHQWCFCMAEEHMGTSFIPDHQQYCSQALVVAWVTFTCRGQTPRPRVPLLPWTVPCDGRTNLGSGTLQASALRRPWDLDKSRPQRWCTAHEFTQPGLWQVSVDMCLPCNQQN